MDAAVEDAATDNGAVGRISLDIPERQAADGVSSINIQFNYDYDTNNFFTSEVRAELERAASVLEGWILDDLGAIDSSGNAVNSWTALFENPTTGANESVDDLFVPADTVIIYVGARDLAGVAVGEGGPGGYSAGGTQDFLDSVSTRGEGVTEGATANEFAPWGGSITFSTSESWNFSSNLAESRWR